MRQKSVYTETELEKRLSEAKVQREEADKQTKEGIKAQAKLLKEVNFYLNVIYILLDDIRF